MVSSKAGIQDIDVKVWQDKVVLVRVDYSVPLLIPGTGLPSGLPGAMHVVANDSKIRASLKTVRYLLETGAVVLLLSHLGRPDIPDHADEDDVDIRSQGDGKVDSKLPVRWYKAALTLRGLMYKLTELLDDPTVDISFCDYCIGSARHAEVQLARERESRSGRGQLILLENVRFYREEVLNTPSFCAALAQDVDFFVNEAFSVSHRAHASIVGIKPHLKTPLALAGYHFQAEQKALEQCFQNPKRPFACIIGGKKMSAKIPSLRSLLCHANMLLIGGAMSFTFLRAQGLNTGKSPVEEDCVSEAQSIMQLAESKGVKVVLPADFVFGISSDLTEGECKTGCSSDSAVSVCKVDAIPANAVCYDIGPATLQRFREQLRPAKMVLWNGPLGKCEVDPFSEGTNCMIDHLATMTEQGAVTVVAGGDTVACVEKHLHLNDKARLTVSQGGHGPHTRIKDARDCFTHMSLAGGAALEFLANRAQLPGLDAVSFVAEIPEAFLPSERDKAAAAAALKKPTAVMLAQPDLH